MNRLSEQQRGNHNVSDYATLREVLALGLLCCLPLVPLLVWLVVQGGGLWAK